MPVDGQLNEVIDVDSIPAQEFKFIVGMKTAKPFGSKKAKRGHYSRCACGCGQRANSAGEARLRCLTLTYPKWAGFSKERKAELRGVKGPAKYSAKNKIKNDAARAKPGFAPNKYLPGREGATKVKGKRNRAVRVETQFNEIALQLGPSYDASPGVERECVDQP